MASTGLTVSKVAKLTEPGRYGDGNCLYLVLPKTGGKYYVCRVTIHGRQCDIGLGGAAYTSLAEAREQAAQIRKIARAGGDPRQERKKERLTFAQAAERVHASLEPTWRNAKHAAGWLSTVKTYANPQFGNRPIEAVTTADCLKALAPIWTTKHETAKRLRQRLATVFDWAKGAGHYPHENPINGISKALPNYKPRVQHHPALPWQEVPALIADLAKREGISARTLEFLILTATRSGEARGARHCEIDRNTWTVPADRMKRGIAHRIPLSPQAMGVLERVNGLGEDLVFPSPNGGNLELTQSDASVRALLNRMKRTGFTVHGFRSAFRDWASESAHADREVAEAALSHAIGTDTERAYARSDLFERRRSLMEHWGRYCSGEKGKVVKLA
ncbi:tyrosine-type recombinase/integrase [Sulfitobacter dubius]|uniref:tyrosine-type recombinase/integrase n=1 Tax=Sulfitobacter dubius TaxID=218673 RepID=UPI0008E280A1|nr:site-specific integrase [Sulfitobacter dubius]SFG68817.1 Integrase [Sulfitobacter dubius]